MTTRAELQARVTELERSRAELLALFDAINETVGATGVQVIAQWDGTNYRITVAGKGIDAEQAAYFAGVFQTAARLCLASWQAGAKSLGDERDAERAAATHGAREGRGRA